MVPHQVQQCSPSEGPQCGAPTARRGQQLLWARREFPATKSVPRRSSSHALSEVSVSQVTFRVVFLAMAAHRGVAVVFLPAVAAVLLLLVVGQSSGQQGRRRSCVALNVVDGADGCAEMFPWHVILADTNDEIFCGGSLVGPKAVITAGHCVAQNREKETIRGRERTFWCPNQNITYRHPDCASSIGCPLGKIKQ